MALVDILKRAASISGIIACFALVFGPGLRVACRGFALSHDAY